MTVNGIGIALCSTSPTPQATGREEQPLAASMRGFSASTSRIDSYSDAVCEYDQSLGRG